MGCDETTSAASRSSPTILRLSPQLRSEWDWHSDLALIDESCLVHLCLQLNDGGMGLYRRRRASRLEGSLNLHDLLALHLRGGSALPHYARLHAPAEAAAARPAPEEEVQGMGTHLAEKDGLGTRSWLRTSVAVPVTQMPIAVNTVQLA